MEQTTEKKRLLWRCRRGMLELDLLLERFVRQRYAAMPAAQLQAFDQLLDLPDNELWDLATGRAQCDDPSLEEVLALLRETGLS